MNSRRLAVALLLSGLVVVGTATPALAHAELIASTPAEGAKLATPPKQVKLTFNEPVTPAASPLTVTGPGGTSWTVGKATLAGAVVTVPVQPSGPAGSYTLTYNVISDDGDAVTGTVSFTLTAAATPTTTAPTTTTTPPTTTESATNAAASTSDSGSGVPVWVWIVGAAVVFAIALLVVLRMSRTRRP